jgi:hypothetical protein
MMDAVQVFPQLMEVAGDLVAKAQDWPGADELAERLQKTIPQQFLKPEDQTQPDPQMQQMQMELQAMGQELQNLKVDKSIELRKTEIQAFDAETKRITAVADIELGAETLKAKTESDAMKSKDVSPGGGA